MGGILCTFDYFKNDNYWCPDPKKNSYMSKKKSPKKPSPKHNIHKLSVQRSLEKRYNKLFPYLRITTITDESKEENESSTYDSLTKMLNRSLNETQREGIQKMIGPTLIKIRERKQGGTLRKRTSNNRTQRKQRN